MTMLQTILRAFCILFKVYYRLLVTLLLAYFILGIHVVQPLLVLKYKNNTSYQKLILLRKSVIGDNLANTEAEKLLDNSVSKPVFEFVI